MKNGIVYLFLVFAGVFWYPAPAQAQYASFPCPNGPGPGERVIGQQGGNGVLLCGYSGEAQSQQQQQQAPRAPIRPTYSTDSYYAVVTHPGANDVWAAYRYYNMADAKKDSLANCAKMMGAGCAIAISGMNEEVTIYDVNDGSLRWLAIHEDSQDYLATSNFLKQCLAEGRRCYKKRVVYSNKILNFVDEGPRDSRMSYSPEDKAATENLYGAIVWTGAGSNKIFSSGGHTSRVAAQKAALALCQKSAEASSCQIAISVANNIMLVSWDKKKNIQFDSEITAPVDVKLLWKLYDKMCKSKKPKCTLKHLVQARQPGDFEKIIL